MMLIRAPGVYRPQTDTHLLARAYTDARIPPHSRVVDVCTGTAWLTDHGHIQPGQRHEELVIIRADRPRK